MLLENYPHVTFKPNPREPYLARAWPFEPSDTEYLYEANLKRQPDTWYYRTHTVTYTWNSNGYRAPEWPEVAWADSYVILGCSHVVGIGVAYEDTLGEQLSRLLGAPVVNLGIGGSSSQLMLANSLRLIDAGIRPKGVITVEPQLERAVYWQGLEYHSMIANQRKQDFDLIIQAWYEAYLRYPPMAERSGYMAMRSIQALWQSVAVPIYMSYYSQHPTSPEYNQGLFLPPRQDYARDIDIVGGNMIGHFGPKTLGSWARALAGLIQSA